MMRNESTVDPTTEERKTPVPTQGNNDNKRLALLEGNGRETKQHQFCGSQQPAAAVVTKKMDLDWGASRDSLRLLSTYSFDSCFLFLFF
jgi:hypothetical protein